MATYKEKVGTSVVNYAGNYPGAVEGELWYDSTNKDFKYLYPNVTSAGSWRTGNNINSAREITGGGLGTQTAGIIAGGNPLTADTEAYDGTSWTEVNNLNTNRYNGVGFGLNSAGILATGYNPPNNVASVESWNGTNWTEVNDVNNARRGVAGGGTATSGLIASGTSGLAYVETWNGTNWTETTDLSTPRTGGHGSVTDSTAAIVYGGYNPGPANTIASNESWNGSSWTEVNDLNTARSNGQGVGTSTDGLLAAGYKDTPSPAANVSPAVTELWNGTSWTETTDLSTPTRNYGASSNGTSSAAFLAGGYTSTTVASTYDWTGAGAAVGAWSTGGSLNTARQQLLSSVYGTPSASIAAGGYVGGSAKTETESYNGSSWTEVNDLNTARRLAAGAGTSTSALAFGGGPPAIANNETWDGTSWTETGDLNTARLSLAGAGASNTAALAFGGYTSTKLAVTETWNGTNWTEVNDLNTAIRNLGGAGTNTSALAFGGRSPTVAETELWNGTNWTEVNDMNTARYLLGGCGANNTAALAFGGYTSPPNGNVGNTEDWNGSSWQETSDLSTARYAIGSSGTSTAALGFGGFGPDPSPAPTDVTEEWNLPSNTVKVLTD